MSSSELSFAAGTHSVAPSFGFLIDNRKCIGCHACTTACKSENEVPLGVNRTWVKYTEKGTFPHTRRFFQVTRCNHCANPPCVTICPTRAMFQRPDGIVEFDGARCIGCKACMQACPYDAIYIDPESHTAAKCHFCAHRTDVGLEPACVVVCPVHAIVAGDMNDPASELSRALATQQVRVRKPEQGTKPKLFYIDAEESSIVPSLAAQDEGMLWATLPAAAHSDWRGPLRKAEGRMAGSLMQSAPGAREVYNVPHRVPWHWQVPAYLVTKAIGTGIFLLVAPVLALSGGSANAFGLAALFLSLFFIAITTGLLVADLDRPERFWTIMTRPQWRSWLTRGAFILAGFSALGGLFFLGHLAGAGDLVNWLAWPAAVLAVLSAVYTAFLFAQAEGRDLWQSTLLPWHLFVQALMCGSGFLLLLAPLFNAGFAPEVQALWQVVFAASLVLNLVLTLGGEFAVPHASQVAAAAAHMITHGRFRTWYWFSIIGGLLVPLLLLALAPALAGLLAIAGLFAYEWAFVMAPQQIPNN